MLTSEWTRQGMACYGYDERPANDKTGSTSTWLAGALALVALLLAICALNDLLPYDLNNNSVGYATGTLLVGIPLCCATYLLLRARLPTEPRT